MNSRADRARALGMLRTYRQMSQRRLAQLSGVNKATLSGYERGHRSIGSDNLLALLEALGVPERAWEATVRHVQWVDYLGNQSQRAATTLHGSDVLILAETIARDVERGVTEVLHLVMRPPRAGAD